MSNRLEARVIRLEDHRKANPFDHLSDEQLDEHIDDLDRQIIEAFQRDYPPDEAERQIEVHRQETRAQFPELFYQDQSS